MRLKSRFLSVLLALTITSWPEAASSLSPSLIPDCLRTVSTGIPDPNEPKIFGLYFTGSNDFFERVDPVTKLAVDSASSIVGCYVSGRVRSIKDEDKQKFFSLWSIGVVDKDSSGYFWRNNAGSVWRLTPDFAQNRFTTGADYPYRSYGNFVEFSVPFNSSKPESCQLMEYGQNFSPGFSRKSWLFYGKDVVRYKVIVPTFANETTAIDPKQAFDGLEVQKTIDFIKSQSYGKVTLKFEYVAIPDKMPGRASDYYDSSGKLMDLAFKSFAKINPQSDYEGLVFTLSKEYSNKDAGYATGFSYNWTQKPEDTKIRVIWMGAAPFNWNDPYAPPWKVLAHEVGHNFGLADLYAVPNNSEMIDSFKGDTSGPWDLMGTLSSPGNEMSFWSRWLLGWLKDSQVNCITDASSASTTSLSPIGINDAQAKGIVIPLSRYTALLIESRRSVGYDSRLLADETGLLVYKLDTRISSGAGPIKIIAKNNVYTDRPFSMALHDMTRYLKAPLQINDSLTVDGYTIINVGDAAMDKALVIKGSDPRPTAKVESRLASEYLLTELSVPYNFVSTSSADFVVSSKSPEVCVTTQDKIVFSNSGTCQLDVIQKADPNFRNTTGNLFSFTIRDNRNEAIAKNIYYEDKSACHPQGINGAFQILRDKEWIDYLKPQGWNRPNDCPSTHPLQPWLITELPSNTQYRWRFYAQGWTTDFFSPIKIAPMTAADLEAKIKAEQEAARIAAQASAMKKTTITCLKGKAVKKITAIKPKCPSGYKLKK